MELIDYGILAVVAVILTLAVWYVRRSKKKGRKCVGCPDSASCSGNCSSCDSKLK